MPWLENLGAAGPQMASPAPTTYEVKAAHRQLSDFSDEELKRIRILPAGTRLEQGATYVDLKDLTKGAFTARGNLMLRMWPKVTPTISCGTVYSG
jgi:hypothetical protein